MGDTVPGFAIPKYPGTLTAQRLNPHWNGLMPGEWPSDAELLQQIGTGEEPAFTELYRRRQSAVYRFALQMSGSAAIAEDATQEVFITLIHEARRFDASRGSVAAFLYGIARNHVRRALARERYDPIAEEAEVASVDDLQGDVVRSRMVDAVRAAVVALPVHYREVVVLCDIHEMDYAEAAAALGCALGTVRSRLHRARQLLAERLGVRSEPALGIRPARCET